MKKTILCFVIAPLILLVACEGNHKDLPTQNSVKILGKWKLLKAVEEEYHPIGTLAGTDITTGEPGDSVIFKPNGMAATYSDAYGMEEVEYHFVNSNTLSIDDEEYKIGS